MNDYFYADLEEAARWTDAQADFAEYLEEELYQDVEEDTFMSTEIVEEMSYSTFVCNCGKIYVVVDQDPFLVDDNNSKLSFADRCPKCEEKVETKANRQKFSKRHCWLIGLCNKVWNYEPYYNSMSLNNRQWFFNCTSWHRDGLNLERKGIAA